MYKYMFFTDNATTVHCELYIRSFGSISPVTMVSTRKTPNVFKLPMTIDYIIFILKTIFGDFKFIK